MPKLKPDVITSLTLEQYLRENDDFAFEIACMRELQKRPAIKVAHAGTYSDPITSKNRQFDFRIEFAPLNHLRIGVALECKNLRPNFPLMISRLPRLQEESFHQLLIPAEEENHSHGFIIPATRLMRPSREVRLDAPTSPYNEGEMVGKATAQIGQTQQGEFHSDDSEVYEKWAQAVSSAYDLISEANRAFADDEELKAAYMILPVVVVPDGTLWVKDYQLDGTPAGPPGQTDETTFYLNHSLWKKGQMFSYTISHLHFVTKKGLGSFIDRHLLNSNFHQLILPSQ